MVPHSSQARPYVATTGDVILNRDDERIAALHAVTDARPTYYGVSTALRPLFPTDEELYGGPIAYGEAHAQVELTALPSTEMPTVEFRIGDSVQRLLLRAEGPHNAQNAAGAAAVALTFGMDAETIATGLAEVEPAFGRGQRFAVDGRTVVLQLVKNPAGFRQTLRTLDGATPAAALLIVINDDYADGRDVSWLWDVDFRRLAEVPARISTAGTRAADMAVRLRYDDVATSEIEPDPEKAVRSAVNAVPAGTQVVVFATYTAMWGLHSDLLAMGVAQ